MDTQLQTHEPEIIQTLIINGDLSKLNAQDKVIYYKLFCQRLGLDPLTQPFKILKLNGKEVLYCDRSGAQQLNKKHNVSHEVKSREKVDDLYVVTCRASIGDRFTDSIGAVTIGGLKGDALANAIMKTETKAKRRATLDLLGLGLLDETETETIPQAHTIDVPYSCDELRDEYLRLLTSLEVYGTIDSRLLPDNWKKEQNSDNFLKAIQHVKGLIEQAKSDRENFSTPQTVEEIGNAASRAADIDDFAERKKQKA